MNNFREWLSDNLRYILLILGILVILVGLFFGVRALSRRFGSSGNDEFSSDSVVSDAANSVMEAVSSSDTVNENKGGQLAENAVPEVTELIQKYYDAIEKQDVSAVRELCDTLPETEAAKIASSTTKYTDLKVYTKNGLAAGSYVVYAYYHYQNEGQTAPLPGLSRMLVRRNESGTWQIIYSDYDQATSDYIDELEQEDDVKALVQQVQQEYDAASQSASSGGSSAGTSSDTAAASSVSETPSASSETEASGSDSSAAESETANAESSSAETAESRSSSSDTESRSSRAESRSSNSTRTTTLNADCFVRSSPSYSGSVLGQVKAGTEVTVIGDIEDGWWHIRTGSYDGYVGRRFIS